MSNVRIGDVDINVWEGFSQLNLDTYFFPAENEPKATCKVKLWSVPNIGEPTEEDLEVKIDLAQKSMELTVVVDKNKDMVHSEYYVRRYLSFFAGLLSEEYSMVHGAGIQIDGKGILILGKSGAGKSTLVSKFLHEAEVVDDDMIMTDWKTMQRTCKWGQSYKSEEYKQHIFRRDNFYSCPLDYIIVLRRRQDAKRIENGWPDSIREFMFDDRLPPQFFPTYRKKTTIPPEDIPVYRVGTNGPESVSMNSITSIIK
ncbi:hypothetical protein ISS07_04035 [Candidatus Woesearchaeota archaeon]|nr:hypothetical protein [Candidatus Woesearchaeota archaeon]